MFDHDLLDGLSYAASGAADTYKTVEGRERAEDEDGNGRRERQPRPRAGRCERLRNESPGKVVHEFSGRLHALSA